jgi:thiamine biosynthesis lipoprotein
MGTFLRVDVAGDARPAAFDGCFAAARMLDRTFSRFDSASELVRLNTTGGGPASETFRRALAEALVLGRATGGAFDVSVGALTALWREPGTPARAAVAAARRTLGHVAIAGDRVDLGAGTRLDFDGFAKGVAVDACVAALRAEGVTRALVTLGESSLYALGAPVDARAWRLDVRGPDPELAVARLGLRDEAAAVSAVFGGAGRRSPGQNGHVIDPRSGTPLHDEAASIVVAPSATDAEAYAKLVLVRGADGVAAAEATGTVRAARITPDGVAMGAAMRASGALHALARPHRLDGEAVLR